MAIGDERFTGADALVKIGEQQVPVTNVSWDREVETTEVQHTQANEKRSSLEASIAVSGLRYSGSFEYDGKNEAVRSLFFRDSGEPKRFNMTVKEESDRTDNSRSLSGSSRTYTFTNGMVSSVSRDVPADDVGSTSVDFVAEAMNVDGGGGESE